MQPFKVLRQHAKVVIAPTLILQHVVHPLSTGDVRLTQLSADLWVCLHRGPVTICYTRSYCHHLVETILTRIITVLTLVHDNTTLHQTVGIEILHTETLLHEQMKQGEA